MKKTMKIVGTAAAILAGLIGECLVIRAFLGDEIAIGVFVVQCASAVWVVYEAKRAKVMEE